MAVIFAAGAMAVTSLGWWAFRPDEERDESVVAEERIAATAAAAAAATADEVSTFIEQQPYDPTNSLADLGANNRSRSSSVTTSAAGAAAAHGTMQRNQAQKSKDADNIAAADDTWDHQQSPLGRLTTEELTALIQRNRAGSRSCLSLLSSASAKVVVLMAWATWLLGGAAVYSWLNNWPYAQSFYYAANVGYSIGFGALSETSDVSRIFSVVLIGAGASAIGGALGFFVAGALEDNDSYSGEASHLDWTADQDGDGDVDCTDRCLVLKARTMKFYADNKTRVHVFTLLIIWLAAGVLYGMLVEDWGLVTSIYFSVAALSTGGLQAPSTNSDGIIPASHAAFVGIFVATGVPIFAFALGQFAGIFVERYAEEKERQTLRRLITRKEFDAVKGIDGGDEEDDDNTVNWGEFLALELIRLGKTNLAQVLDIKDQFDERDYDHSGTLHWDEILRYQRTRVARSLEADKLVRVSGLSLHEAQKIVENYPVSRLTVLKDLELYEAHRKQRRNGGAHGSHNSHAKSISGSNVNNIKSSKGTQPTPTSLLAARHERNPENRTSARLPNDRNLETLVDTDEGGSSRTGLSRNPPPGHLPGRRRPTADPGTQL